MLPSKKASTVWAVKQQIEDSWTDGYTDNYVTINLYATEEAANKAAEYYKEAAILERFNVPSKFLGSEKINLPELESIIKRLHPEISEPLKIWLSEPGNKIDSKAVCAKIKEIAMEEERMMTFAAFKVETMVVWGE